MNFILVQTHFNIGRTKDLSRVMSALKTPLRAQIWLWTYWTLSHTLWVTTGFLTGCSYFVSRDHKSHNPDHSDDPSFSVMTFRFWSKFKIKNFVSSLLWSVSLSNQPISRSWKYVHIWRHFVTWIKVRRWSWTDPMQQYSFCCELGHFFSW